MDVDLRLIERRESPAMNRSREFSLIDESSNVLRVVGNALLGLQSGDVNQTHLVDPFSA
jgi:hypothetical protein